ncbi:hypothetical protein AKJ08_0891 [Vulgatibacter incomptus]|uniref:N-acetyltransferase domain-containing protein n=1 Tax=Vulgatibacter incomptus TaxID=1391653 RepID=A0A0K1PBK4_9BACT|nr:hypothetical protein AKJ08_0891 [Vulgatibacter incomptus]
MAGQNARDVSDSILRTEDELLALGCEELALPYARALRDRRLPLIYDVNGIRDVRGTPAFSELADAFRWVTSRGGPRHCRLVSRDADTIVHLDELLLPRGYGRQVCISMALTRPVPDISPPRGLRIVVANGDDDRLLDGIAHCQDLVRREELWYGPEVSRQMDAMAFRQMRLGGAEFLAATTRNGEVVASLLLWCRDDVGFIADVGTAPAYRRRGVASSLVAAAAALATERGCSVVGLTARRDDTPRRIYEALGFEPMGVSVDWLRSA